MNQADRIQTMASIMVEARKAQRDIGDIIAASLHRASQQLGDVYALTSGRPGSWEADITRRMAYNGEHSLTKPDKPFIAQLTSLFVEMGEAKEDGGDVLSRAMGKAVNELGGLNAFAGNSQWYHDLINIGCQYSDYEYPTH